MANQESGSVKQLKLRIPMELYVQLEIDAQRHGEAPATRARHILLDQLMDIELTDSDRERVRRLIDANWIKIERSRSGGEV